MMDRRARCDTGGRWRQCSSAGEAHAQVLRLLVPGQQREEYERVNESRRQARRAPHLAGRACAANQLAEKQRDQDRARFLRNHGFYADDETGRRRVVLRLAGAQAALGAEGRGGGTMRLQLKAARVASRTCFAALPAHVADALLNQHALGAGAALEASWQTDAQQQCSVLLTWAGGSSAKPDTLELSHAMCDAIGLADGALLTVTMRPKVAAISRINVEPRSADDWEVMQLHAGLLEDQILNQVRAVVEGMTLPLWISPSSMVRVHVKSLYAGTATVASGLLALNSEVVVAPLERKVAGVASVEERVTLLRVLAREHWEAARGPTTPAQANGCEAVLLPIGIRGQPGSQRTARPAGEAATGSRGAAEACLGLYLLRGVQADGEPVSLPSEEGSEGTGASSRRVRVAVADASAHASVPRRHVVLSRVLR